MALQRVIDLASFMPHT